ncbi:MAG: bifunctional serine/threonine-protein kinase/formylglycine-generating enzyme family protein [Prevotella sp.]|nr:bifunctional serine/threonine-protein kinase/formylglycine-generating enzyme family protein [Prevotella sp.]
MGDNRSIHKFKHGDEFHDRYILDRLIGSGGFADVWKAIDKSAKDSVVALKIYTNLDEDGIKDLSGEYVRMKDLNHPNIVRAEHFDTCGNIPYLVMKLCEGGSLSKRVGQMSDDEILLVMRDVAQGLKYLHESGIVHQDIKPANILIDTKGTNNHYVLSDFGISTKTKTQLSRSVNQKNLGTSMTEAYAPPEKFSNKREDRLPDRKGDIFSYGISIYELATGGMPFDDLATGRQLLHDDDVEVDFSEIKNEKIRNIVELCMQKDKESRPTAEEVVGMLNSSDIPEPPERGYGSGKHTVRVETERSGAAKYILIVVIALAIAALCFFLFPQIKSCDSGQEAKKGFVQEIDTFTINGIRLEMVKIPGGSFWMGSDDADADEFEKPSQKREVSTFYMSKYEVTQKQWQVLMNNNPSTVINDRYPVNNVSWEDCQLFIQRLNSITGRNFRLPTETEWEYAAKVVLDEEGNRTENSSKYAGTSSYPEDYAWYEYNSSNTIHTVGSKKPNPYGLYDMSGNVIEWCQDIFTSYATGNVEIDKNQRVIRGGFYSSDAASIRCTSRGSCQYNQALEPLGFRLCLQ